MLKRLLWLVFMVSVGLFAQTDIEKELGDLEKEIKSNLKSSFTDGDIKKDAGVSSTNGDESSNSLSGNPVEVMVNRCFGADIGMKYAEVKELLNTNYDKWSKFYYYNGMEVIGQSGAEYVSDGTVYSFKSGVLSNIYTYKMLMSEVFNDYRLQETADYVKSITGKSYKMDDDAYIFDFNDKSVVITEKNVGTSKKMILIHYFDNDNKIEFSKVESKYIAAVVQTADKGFMFSGGIGFVAGVNLYYIEGRSETYSRETTEEQWQSEDYSTSGFMPFIFPAYGPSLGINAGISVDSINRSKSDVGFNFSVGLDYYNIFPIFAVWDLNFKIGLRSIVRSNKSFAQAYLYELNLIQNIKFINHPYGFGPTIPYQTLDDLDSSTTGEQYIARLPDTVIGGGLSMFFGRIAMTNGFKFEVGGFTAGFIGAGLNYAKGNGAVVGLAASFIPIGIEVRFHGYFVGKVK